MKRPTISDPSRGKKTVSKTNVLVNYCDSHAIDLVDVAGCFEHLGLLSLAEQIEAIALFSDRLHVEVKGGDCGS